MPPKKSAHLRFEQRGASREAADNPGQKHEAPVERGEARGRGVAVVPAATRQPGQKNCPPGQAWTGVGQIPTAHAVLI
eukprot:828296-Lingulodinium_polyedra.AAC.1